MNAAALIDDLTRQGLIVLDYTEEEVSIEGWITLYQSEGAWQALLVAKPPTLQYCYLREWHGRRISSWHEVETLGAAIRAVPEE